MNNSNDNIIGLSAEPCEEEKIPCLDQNSWNPEFLTSKKCKHCKNRLCEIEVKICKKDWKQRFHRHWCCYVCFQRKHL